MLLLFIASIIFTLIFSIKFFLYPYNVAKKRNHKNSIPVLFVSFIPIIGFWIAITWAFSNDIYQDKDLKYTNKELILRGVKLLIFSILGAVIIVYSGFSIGIAESFTQAFQ